MEIPNVTFAYGETLTLEQIYNNLVDAMDMVFLNAIGQLADNEIDSDLFQAANDLFGTIDGLPDAGSIYGILLNSFSVAIRGFGDSQNIGIKQGRNVLIESVEIKDLYLNVREVPAIEFDDCADINSNGIARGPFGDVMDIRKMVDASQVEIIETVYGDLSLLNYVGNVLSDAQIALYLYGDYVQEETDYAFGSYISPYLLQWAVADYVFHEDDTGGLLPQCGGFVCNGDIMFHTNKGVVGLRVDGIDDVSIDGVIIRKLENLSPPGSFACGNYTGPRDGGIGGTREGQGAMNTDIRGISITDSDVTVLGDNVIDILDAEFGDCTGIDLMEGSVLEFDTSSNMEISRLREASELQKNFGEFELLMNQGQIPYPNNFELCVIRILDESVVINAPNDLIETDCGSLFNLE